MLKIGHRRIRSEILTGTDLGSVWLETLVSTSSYISIKPMNN